MEYPRKVEVSLKVYFINAPTIEREKADRAAVEAVKRHYGKLTIENIQEAVLMRQLLVLDSLVTRRRNFVSFYDDIIQVLYEDNLFLPDIFETASKLWVDNYDAYMAFRAEEDIEKGR